MDSTSQCRCGKVLKEHVRWKILYKIQCAICKLSGYHSVGVWWVHSGSWNVILWLKLGGLSGLGSCFWLISSSSWTHKDSERVGEGVWCLEMGLCRQRGSSTSLACHPRQARHERLVCGLKRRSTASVLGVVQGFSFSPVVPTSKSPR